MSLNNNDHSNFNLRKLPRSMWKHLRNLYLEEWPVNMIGYYTLDNYIRWMRIEPNIKNIHIYTLELIGLRFRRILFNGTFLIVDNDQLFFNTLNGPDMKSLEHALHLFDWSPGYEVSAVLERHKSTVMKVIEYKGLSIEWGNIATPMALFKKENAADLELNIPDDVDLRPLSEKDVIIADTVWANRNFGSLLLLKRLVKLNPSIGAFKNDTGEIVACCFQLQGGSIKTLQVKDKNMRMGYGSLVVRAMIKVLAANNCDTFTCVREGNDASLNTIKKIGFEFMDVCNWLHTKPVDKKQFPIEGILIKILNIFFYSYEE